MKKLFISIVVCCFFLPGVQAQLANSQWKGFAYTPDSHPILWKFDKDTVTVFFTDSADRPEIMTYKEDKDKMMVTITKISGGSPCDSGTVGVYSYTIADDKLSMKPSQEPCQGRAAAVAGATYTRMK